jgi:hypothetical protein
MTTPLPLHPAHLMHFDTLVCGLNATIADGHVYERRDGELSLFYYTQSMAGNCPKSSGGDSDKMRGLMRYKVDWIRTYSRRAG